MTMVAERVRSLSIPTPFTPSKLPFTSLSPSAPEPAGKRRALPPARMGPATVLPRERAEGGGDAGLGLPRVGGGIDSMHPASPRSVTQDERGAARQHGDLVGGQPVMSYGLLRGAFRPGDAVCPLRSYARQMRRLTGDRSRCVLHMQKALTEMNVRLDSVIANITGLTGQRILRAIIDGERDPERLATLRHRGIKADADTIAASLQGTWREEHLFALEQAMQRYDFLTQQIDDCEVRVMAEIERLTPPDDPPDGGAPDPAPGTISDTASSRSANAATNDIGREGIQPLALRKMMGVDLTAIPTVGPGTALVIASEIGPDFSAFPSAQHFCSWLALAPGTRISGGKNLPGKSPKAVNPVGQALRMAAMAARRSQTFIGAKHRARLARMDTPVAIKATARELACLVYLMVTEGQEYVEQGIGAYEKRRLNRKFAHLDRQARKLGLQLVPKMQGEEKQNPMLSIA